MKILLGFVIWIAFFAFIYWIIPHKEMKAQEHYESITNHSKSSLYENWINERYDTLKVSDSLLIVFKVVPDTMFIKPNK